MSGREFELIERYFAPLSEGAEGAFGLADDAALLSSESYVVSKDVLVEGVHFRKADPLSSVAKKALRVNLSDLAAKGARPIGYFLGCVWSKDTAETDIEAFTAGLAEDNDLFRVRLFGGDTTRHKAANAPSVFSVTAFGAPARLGLVARSGASVGDDIYVSGAIGDGSLGLEADTERLKLDAQDTDYLNERYQLPTPRVKLGSALSGLASAAIDVSDGLIADCGHLCRASDTPLHARIDASALPLSEPAQRWLHRKRDQNKGLVRLATGGDDYEILFTAAPVRRRSVAIAAEVAKTPVTRIGTMEAMDAARAQQSDDDGSNGRREDVVQLVDHNGAEIDIHSLTDKPGFDHF
ncbi:MAG: thiamine-phosphate kinase [Pseudomonadota bacterium]